MGITWPHEVWNFSHFQLAVEYESNALIVKVDTDEEYDFARDMQVKLFLLCSSFFFSFSLSVVLKFLNSVL